MAFKKGWTPSHLKVTIVAIDEVLQCHGILGWQFVSINP